MSTQKPKQKRIPIKFPENLNVNYANFPLITITPAEFFIDFVQVVPRTLKGEVVSRILMNPVHAKAFLNALQKNIDSYERQHGEIKVQQAPNLADQFFSFPQNEGGDESDGDEPES